MTTTQIGELVDRVKTWNPSRCPDDEFEYIDLSAVDSRSKVIVAPTTLRGADAPSRARQLVVAGDVLVSTVRPNLNAVAVVPPELDGATASTGFTVLRPGDDLDGRFLFHWVQAPAFVADMVRKATGASYPAVSDRIVKGSLMPTPPLSEQRRIAAILDHADALRTKRRQVLTYLDVLTQSIFSEMFVGGSFPAAQIGSLGDVTTGKTPPTAANGMFNGSIPFITPGDLGSGRHAARTVTEAGAAASRTVRSGATLVCCIGATIGKMDIAREFSAFNQQINAIEWGDRMSDTYGLFALRRLKAQIVSRGASTTLPLLPKGQFVKLEVPVPPLDLQNQFEERVERIEASRASSQRALDAEDELFASLQSRSFRGEL